MKWIKDESMKKPEEVDFESSPTTIYLHRNIEEVALEEGVKYIYETAKLTPEEFQIYVAAQQYKKLTEG